MGLKRKAGKLDFRSRPASKADLDDGLWASPTGLAGDDGSVYAAPSADYGVSMGLKREAGKLDYLRRRPASKVDLDDGRGTSPAGLTGDDGSVYAAPSADYGVSMGLKREAGKLDYLRRRPAVPTKIKSPGVRGSADKSWRRSSSAALKELFFDGKPAFNGNYYGLSSNGDLYYGKTKKTMKFMSADKKVTDPIKLSQFNFLRHLRN